MLKQIKAIQTKIYSEIRRVFYIFYPYKWIIIDGYVLKLFLKSVINSLIMFVSINLFAAIAIDLPDYINAVEGSNSPVNFEGVMLVYLYQLPIMITTISPIAFLLSTIYTIDQIYKNSEAVACISAGLHALRITVCIWILALIQCFILIVINDNVTVDYLNKSSALKQKLLKRQSSSYHNNFETFGENNLYYFIKKYDSNRKIMEYPIIGKTREVDFNLIRFDKRAFFDEQIAKVSLSNNKANGALKDPKPLDLIKNEPKIKPSPPTEKAKKEKPLEKNYPNHTSELSKKTKTDPVTKPTKKTPSTIPIHPNKIESPKQKGMLPKIDSSTKTTQPNISKEDLLETPIQISQVYKQLKQSRSPMLESKMQKEFINSIPILNENQDSQFNSEQFDYLTQKYLKKQRPIIKDNLDTLIKKQHQYLNPKLQVDKKKPSVVISQPKQMKKSAPISTAKKPLPTKKSQPYRKSISQDIEPKKNTIVATTPKTTKSIVQNVYDLDLLEQIPKDIQKPMDVIRYSKEDAENVSTAMATKKQKQIYNTDKLEERPLENIKVMNLIDSDTWESELTQLSRKSVLNTAMAKLKNFSVNLVQHEKTPFPSYFEYRIDAKRAEWKEELKKWKLYQLYLYKWDKDNNLTNVEYKYSYVLQDGLDPPEHFLTKPKSIDKMKLEESLRIVDILKRSRKKWKGFYVDIYYKKIAFMFSTFLIVLVGSTLSKVHSRKLLFLNSLFKAIILFLAYFVISQGGVSLFKGISWFPIMITPWVGNILFLCLGFVLLRRVQT